MASIIEVAGVSKEFQLGQLKGLGQTVRNGVQRALGRQPVAHAAFKALDDVSFSVGEGEVFGIIGHNGAGKSTLLKLLAGISKPTRGHIAVRGRVAPLIEVGAGLVPEMTGRENVFLNAAILGMKRAEIKRRFDEIVAFSELEKFIDTPVKRYSSGMQIKLGFSIATSVNSEILIVDEVLAVGDMAFQRKCIDRMDALIHREGRTVLLVSHDIRHLERLCKRVMMLDRGKVGLLSNAKTVCDAFIDQNTAKIASARSVQAASTQASEQAEDVHLQAIELLDAAGCNTTSVEANEPASVRLTFNLRRELTQATVGVGIHTTDLIFLATVNTEGVLDLPVLTPGQHVVTCHLPPLPLVPGAYAIRVGVTSGAAAQGVFYAEQLLSFQVRNPRLQPLSAANRDGFFVLNATWNVTSDRNKPGVESQGSQLSDQELMS